MSTYHINHATGEVGPCRAVQGKCPFGSPQDHYPSLVSAAVAYEATMSPSTVPMPVSQTQDAWHWNDRNGEPAHCVSKGCPIGDVPHYGTYGETVRAQIPDWSEKLTASALKGSDLSRALKHVELEDSFRTKLYAYAFKKGTKRQLELVLGQFGKAMGRARIEERAYVPDPQHIEALKLAVEKGVADSDKSFSAFKAALPRFPEAIDFLTDHNVMDGDAAERMIARQAYYFSHFSLPMEEETVRTEQLLTLMEQRSQDPAYTAEELKQFSWSLELMNSNRYFSRGFYGDNPGTFEKRYTSLKSAVNKRLKEIGKAAP